MLGKAYVFHHPQYGGLRVIDTDDGLFFCIKDLVDFTDISGNKLFQVLADTEGSVEEFHVTESTKKVPKGYKGRVFFGDAEKVDCSHRKTESAMIFVDFQVVRDMTIGCSNEPERKLFYKWVKNFIQPRMEDENYRWQFSCLLVEETYYHPLEEPMDIRYAADGLYINSHFIVK